MFGLTIAPGLRYLGVLLMGLLIIIPAATTERLANNLSQMLTLSVAIALATTWPVCGLRCRSTARPDPSLSHSRPPVFSSRSCAPADRPAKSQSVLAGL